MATSTRGHSFEPSQFLAPDKIETITFPILDDDYRCREERTLNQTKDQKSGADESGERDKSDERLRQMNAEAVY
ncbi:hypothetical protein CC1G_14893 [Coprinopsis cinerea okayama7|uniref:Uncharacterized protein n=1 Tax=Coprinopsis cinerea (strain Okayama-7 / 130 / ATCC MYA-4618 / FGSC 9003) TaxID=240176 RepID=D6RNK6_COPC7|nr:hypothetical protein CC1G_14893 [Coprinopsis cinerea okayama7\|eukprot:XP_002910916.1 hypothetical protein CC1G_14893 [Coprinopsis cinerea okayama7\